MSQSHRPDLVNSNDEFMYVTTGEAEAEKVAIPPYELVPIPPS